MGTITDQPWEACITMGEQWSYKPGDNYKSSERLIEILIQTRATGGTLLLNVGPKPDGELPIEQEERLHDMALWYFLNKEAIDSVRPWIVPNEGNIWFTRKGNDLFACVTNSGIWQRITERSFVLGTVKSTDSTKITILGQSDEYIRGLAKGKPTTGVWSQQEDGLHFSMILGYQPHAGRKYDKPVVIKLSNVVPSMKAPVFSTEKAEPAAGGSSLLKGKMTDIGDAESVKAGFQYREEPFYGEELYADEWKETQFAAINESGEFTARATGFTPGVNYQYRAVIKHPRVTIIGNIRVFQGK
jgi:alpha-L-fucosidase